MIVVEIKTDSRYPVDRKRLRFSVEKTLQKHGFAGDVTVSVSVVGKRKMQVINKTYHEIDSPTDVLSFPYLDPQSKSSEERSFFTPPGQLILGDLVVCYPVAVEQARKKQSLVDEEVDFLVEHGMEHLLGHHHD